MATLQIVDKFGELLETHSTGNLIKFMRDNVPNYTNSIRPPYTAELNGKAWPYVDHNKDLLDDDFVLLTIEPGAQALPYIYLALAVASAAYAYNIASNLPKGYQDAAQDGSSIYNANARANAVRPSQPIPSIAGSPPSIYPDLICPIHRKYVNHEEFLYMLLCVGEGYYFIRDNHIYISETSIINYSGDITAFIFEPSETISGTIAHENWYESLEVVNLQLSTSTGEVPGNWTIDATAAGDQFTSYLDGVATEFPFVVGEKFEILTGSNVGIFTVDSISGSSNEIATVIAQDAVSNSDAQQINQSRGLNRVRSQSGTPGRTVNSGYAPRTVRPTVDAVSTSLTGVTGESVTWRGLVGGINIEGPYALIPENETTQYIEVDVNFPGGLVELDGSGEPTNKTVEIEIRYRAVGTDTWTTVPSTSYTDNTFDERGYTVSIDIGSPIRPEIDFRLVSPESDSVNIAEDVFIKRVKSRLETPTSYADVTTIALEMRGTNALAVTAENKINIKGAQRKLPTLAELEAGSFNLSKSVTEQGDSYNLGSRTYLSNTTIANDKSAPPVSGGAKEYKIDFTNDGLNMLLHSNQFVRFYELSVAYDPGQGFTYLDYITSSSVAEDDGYAVFAPNGNRVIVLKNSASPATTYLVQEYNFATPFSSTGMTTGSNYTFGSEIDEDASGESPLIYFRNDGLKYWVFDQSTGVINQYSMSTAWDLSTTSKDIETFDVSATSALGATDWTFGDYSGTHPTKFWLLNGDIYQFDFSSSDISGATLNNTYSYSSLGKKSLFVSENNVNFCSFSSVPIRVNIDAYSLPSGPDIRATSSIARFVANEFYNAKNGNVQNDIDWDAFSSFETIVDARSDFLNGEFKDETTLWEAMKVMLSPGYAEPALKTGKLLPVRTAQASNYLAPYTPDMMLDDGLERRDKFYDESEPDGIDVEYLDEDTGEMELVECRLSGDGGYNPKRIQAIGITNRTRAWRFGMRERRRLFYKPAILQFKTELDALNSEYGDAIAIASDIIASQTGTVTDVSGSTVTLDFEPNFGAGTYYAAFKKPDGEFSGLYEISSGVGADEITLTSPSVLDFTPVIDSSPDADGENTLVSLGLSSEWGERAIVRNIQPGGENIVTVTCDEYIAEIYDDDNNSPA